jgi:signal peptidase I
MKSHHDAFKTPFTIITLLLMSITWLLFTPVQFGGQAAYVIISGNSMEPVFYRGDLVILYSAKDYQIGDIATYRHPEIGPVIHRIIEKEDDRFIFQGDNNGWIDSYRPQQEEIIGKLWLHLPTAGKTLETFRAPWVLSLIAALTMLIFIAPPSKQHKDSTHQRNRKSVKEQHPMEKQMANKTDFLVVLVLLTVAALLLVLYTFNQSTYTTKFEDVKYKHVGTFSYSAAAPPGVYASDTVQVGEPIFRQLIDQVTVNFSYHLDSELPSNIRGNHQLDLVVSHNNGWNWSFPLQLETPFMGNQFNATGGISLAHVQALIDNLEQQTGLQNQQYTLSVVPTVTVNGTVAGQEINDRFTSQLTFQLSPLQMQVASSREADPFTALQTESVKQSSEIPNTISILSYQFEVLTVRLLAMIGFIFCCGGALVLGLLIYYDTQCNPIARLQEKFSPLLITVNDPGLISSSQAVEVTSLDDLAKIAERNGRMILQQVHGSAHHFFVQDERTTYHYALVDESKKVKRPAQMMKVRPLL